MAEEEPPATTFADRAKAIAMAHPLTAMEYELEAEKKAAQSMFEAAKNNTTLVTIKQEYLKLMTKPDLEYTTICVPNPSNELARLAEEAGIRIRLPGGSMVYIYRTFSPPETTDK